MSAQRRGDRRDLGHELVGLVNDADADVVTVLSSDARQVEAQPHGSSFDARTDFSTIDRHEIPLPARDDSLALYWLGIDSAREDDGEMCLQCLPRSRATLPSRTAMNPLGSR
jgi:hypothetical protein